MSGALLSSNAAHPEAFRPTWERGKAKPVAAQFRPVVQFLGYDPTPTPETISDSLKAKQRELGVTCAQVARCLKWDPGTLTRYLDGLGRCRRPAPRRWKPCCLLKRLRSFQFSRFQDGVERLPYRSGRRLSQMEPKFQRRYFYETWRVLRSKGSIDLNFISVEIC